MEEIELEAVRDKLEILNELAEQRSKKAEMAAATFELHQTALKRFLEHRETIQSECDHRKGGRYREDDPKCMYHGIDSVYAVIKHRLPNNGTLVICQRCGKEWHPADPFINIPATEGWEQAVKFPTDNISSGSSTFWHGQNSESEHDTKLADSMIRDSFKLVYPPVAPIPLIPKNVAKTAESAIFSEPRTFSERLKIAFQILLGN